MMPLKQAMFLKLTVLGAALALVAAPALAGDDAERAGDPYALSVCAVSGEPLGSMGEPPVKVIEGREVRFCCAGCIKTFEKETEARNQKLDKKMAEDQSKSYPNDKCINTGADLKGGGVSFVAGNRLFKTCCNNCKAKVEANVGEYIEKLDKAVADAQKEDYPLDTDVVTGEELKDDAVEVVIANRLILVNSEDSAKKLEEKPSEYIEKIDKARKG